jgi:hypothetical protein
VTQYSALSLHYLAAHGVPGAHQPSFAELGLEQVVVTVGRLFEMRTKVLASVDDFWFYGDNPYREIAGLFGSIAESVSMCAAAEIEVEWHRRARLVGDLPEGMIVGQRFFSESSAQLLLGVGHPLCQPCPSASAPRRKRQSGSQQDKEGEGSSKPVFGEPRCLAYGFRSFENDQGSSAHVGSSLD